MRLLMLVASYISSFICLIWILPIRKFCFLYKIYIPAKESDLRRERGRPRPIIHAMQVECGIVTYPPKKKRKRRRPRSQHININLVRFSGFYLSMSPPFGCKNWICFTWRHKGLEKCWIETDNIWDVVV